MGKPDEDCAPDPAVAKHPPGHSLAEWDPSQYAVPDWLSASSRECAVQRFWRRMLIFETKRPNALLGAIKAAINIKKVTTWSYDSQGNFTHTPEQWKNRAWLRPSIIEGKALKFAIIRPTGRNVDKEIYGIYHGRFIEMMLAHFDSDFETGSATALAAVGDNVRAA